MQILETVNAFVWGIPTLLLMAGVGVYLTVRTRALQVRSFPKALSMFFQQLKKCSSRENGVSSFQALCTALSATVGIGNIAGVAGAIAIGGPGSVFWMWIGAILGMITKFAEVTLCVHYRLQAPDGTYYGGPMYMIRKGLGGRLSCLAWVYAFFGVVAALGVGNATQINACIAGFRDVLDLAGVAFERPYAILISACLSLLVAVILSGGAKKIGSFSQWLVPFAAVGYLLLGIGVLLLRFDAIPHAFISIINGAFSPKAVTGGVIGSALISARVGFSRGVFTNEAGMGTAGIAHAGAVVKHPVEQGLMGIVEVFLDTLVICTVTALVILTSGVTAVYGVDEGASLTNRAFCAVYGNWISIPITFFLCCFAFATMIGWGLYGLRCAQFLFGSIASRPFMLLQFSASVLSVTLGTGTVWLLSDIVNGLMAFPNLLALWLLTPVFVKLIHEYYERKGPL